ncbi:MAG: hypothetical protein ACTHM1_08115 [Solirubrobacteraceae bacterium]
MTRRHARRAAVALTLSCAALLASGQVGGTLALYEGSATNANSAFAGGWVHDATEMAASPEGYDVALKWTPGSPGVVTQKLYGEDKGTSPACTSVPTHTLSATLASASTSAYKDESRGSEATDGDWVCYEIQGENGSWLSAGAFSAVQVGLVASAVSTVNEATKCSTKVTKAAGKIDCDDTIAITFNQKPVLPASPLSVCVFSTGTIVLGDTETESKEVKKKLETTPVCKTATDASSVGKLTISSGSTVSASVAYTASTYTLSASAPWKMTITLQGSESSASVTGTPTWTLVPVAAIKSSVTTHQAVMCTAEKSTCRPTTTTDF